MEKLRHATVYSSNFDEDMIACIEHLLIIVRNKKLQYISLDNT